MYGDDSKTIAKLSTQFMPTIQINTGIHIYYERVGRGPVLLLIMGTGLNHSCWDAQIAAYRHEFDCIAFDNRGTGQTDSGDEPSVNPFAGARYVGVAGCTGD